MEDPSAAIKEKESNPERSGSQLPSSLSSSFTIRRNKVAHEIPVLTSSATRNDHGIAAVNYEETVAGKPPIPVIRSPPRNPPEESHPALRNGLSAVEDAWKRDSGLATTTSSKPRQDSFGGSTVEEKERELGLKIDFDSNSTIANTNTSLSASLAGGDEGLRKSETKSSGLGSSRWKLPGKKSAPKNTDSVEEDYIPLTTPIPVESLMEEEALNSIQFTKRGSMLMLGSKVVAGHARPNATRRYDVATYSRANTYFDC